MTNKPLIDALQLLENARAMTPHDARDINRATFHVIKALQSRGVFIAMSGIHPQPDNEDAQEILRGQAKATDEQRSAAWNARHDIQGL